MKKSELRESIRKEIRTLLNEAGIDPWKTVSDIVNNAHEVRRALFDNVIQENIFPDEQTGVQIKQAYNKAKELEGLLNQILPKYQDMAIREDQ